MRRVIGLLAILPLLISNQNAPSSLELDRDRPLATILIDGRETTMEVAPDGPNSPIVNASVATELGKRGSMVKGKHMVGRTGVSASSNMARIDYGDGQRVRNRIFWFEKNWTEIAEGRMGPNLLPYKLVTYRLGEEHPDERAITLPMLAHGRAGFRAETTIDGTAIPVIFTFDRSETMVTASTGALLASVYGGSMAGAARDTKLEMGFDRPVREMEFDTPVTIGELLLRDVVIRTTETGSTADIPDEDQDPNEIVVSAKGKQRPVHSIFIGTASFADCSSLSFDKERKEIRLSCVRLAESG